MSKLQEEHVYRMAIPVKPYIKKYLQKHGNDPLLCTRETTIGSLMLHSLRRPLVGRKSSLNNSYSEQASLHIPKFYVEYKGATNVDHDTVHLFHRVVRNEI